ncbi:MAG: SusC/RagA family TonB-linked outer membrane protein [Phocaeicola sp.]
MNLNFRKTSLLLGACSIFGLGYTTPISAIATAEIEAVQQMKRITGSVVDVMGEPIIGANVVEKGTTNGIITDLDGNFVLNVNPNAIVEVSFIGYTTQDIRISNQSTIKVILVEDSKSLDEVVVVGYGVQKKKLVTGATVQVKGDDIAKLNTTSALGALQSQTPGVQITQATGQAGDGFKVNIRGLGTVGNSSPLYVIDGVTGGDINALNPSDIESIDVLKDAASAAIYGARAANGVILITTKQGKSGKIQVSYDGYVGFQYMAKRPDVLNAQEFIYAQELKAFNGGNAAPNWESVLPEGMYQSIIDGSWEGTDWVDESYHKGAMTQNHAFNMIGGSEDSKFSMGFSYTNQDGIFGGEQQSGYERYTARLNSDHVIYKKGNLDVVKIGENLSFNHTGSNGISTGNMYWNNMHDLIVGNPLLPAYDSNGNYYTNAEMAENGWTLGSASNPLALAANTGQGLSESKSWGLNMSTYLEVQPIKNLKWRSQFNYKMGTSTYRSMTRKYATGSNSATQDNASQSMSTWSNISWENTLAYILKVGDHNMDFVIGNTLEKNSYGMDLNASANNNLFGDDWERAYVGNAKPGLLSDISVGGGPAWDSSLASFFGRASYNFQETYMAQVTLRADGSSNFKRGNRWGYFPSASIGWVMSNEPFMNAASSWMDFFKLRASFGQNGNCSIDNFQYLTTFAFDDSNAYYFGLNNHSTQTTGGYANVLKNEDVTWETSEQINVGLDARFLDNRFGVNFDWYRKVTKDWLLRAPILSVYGLNAPYINGGDVENRGIELGLSWNDHVGEFTYGISANMATNKNEVTRIANAEGIIHGPNSVLNQQETEIFRAKVGEPIGYFWGMKTAGVFQNQQQIDEWSTRYEDQIHGKLTPGDLIYVDTNGDGKITLDDKTNIGNPHPDINIGFNISLGYKGFDFSITAAGAFGQQIVRTWDKGESSISNLNKKLVYGSWKGEGTSNFLPRLDMTSNTNWQTFSDIWVEDADYVKIQNITLGYDFKRLWKNCPFPQLRVYASAQNLFTFTGYSGMDPEIGSDGGTGGDGFGWASGIDNGFYPSPRTFLFGVNLKF